jgi:transcriptional regulator with XRE-family HTH domain
MRALAKIIGPNVRRERNRRGLTRDELAKQSGVSVRTIEQIEQGAHEPTLASLTWIATVLETRATKLMEAM